MSYYLSFSLCSPYKLLKSLTNLDSHLLSKIHRIVFSCWKVLHKVQEELTIRKFSTLHELSLKTFSRSLVCMYDELLYGALKMDFLVELTNH